MSPELPPWLAETTAAAMALLSVALTLAFMRLVRGPSLPDRVVAMDLIATVMVGMASVYTVATGSSACLDAALALALIAFLSTVAIARYVERETP